MNKSELLGRPIKRVSIADQVARRILSLIQTGGVAPGDRLLPERELATSLQVSRASVREAIHALVILGIVEARQGSGVFVARPEAVNDRPLRFVIGSSVSGLKKLYEARIEVEQSIGRLAALRISEDDLSRLRELLNPQKALVQDPVGFRMNDSEFHDIIWNSADNPILEKVARSLHALGLERRSVALETPKVLARSCQDHREIVAALADRDPSATAAAMAAHMRNVLKSTRKREV